MFCARYCLRVRTMNKLPVSFNFETTEILKKLIVAHRELALLNGICASIPNQAVLVHTLALQEAKDSSEIENIITTHADIYTAIANPEFSEIKTATKEVLHYVDAIMRGYHIYSKKKILSLSCIEEIQATIECNNAGLRKLPGTALVNDRTNEIVYEPPMPDELPALMDNFLLYFNDDSAWEVDPLVKMAILHYQFESIHPFYDGNGRTGRILNILYLLHEGLLDYPVLYLSRYININKGLYYRYLQSVRDSGSAEQWEKYVLFMLEGVIRTSRLTRDLVTSLKTMMMEYKHRIRDNHPSFYSQDLINVLFSYPYSRIGILKEKLGVSYLTARKYLDILASDNLLAKIRIGRDSYYVNVSMMETLTNLDTDSLKVEH